MRFLRRIFARIRGMFGRVPLIGRGRRRGTSRTPIGTRGTRGTSTAGRVTREIERELR